MEPITLDRIKEEMAVRWVVETMDDTELIRRIHIELQDDFKARYRVLHQRLEDEELTEKERREFIRMTTQGERLNVARLEALSVLGKRRGLCLDEIMKQLSVGPVQAV